MKKLMPLLMFIILASLVYGASWRNNQSTLTSATSQGDTVDFMVTWDSANWVNASTSLYRVNISTAWITLNSSGTFDFYNASVITYNSSIKGVVNYLFSWIINGTPGTVISWSFGSNDTSAVHNKTDTWTHTLATPNYVYWKDNTTTADEYLRNTEKVYFGVTCRATNPLIRNISSVIFMYDNGTGSFNNVTNTNTVANASYIANNSMIPSSTGVFIRWRWFCNDTSGLINMSDMWNKSVYSHPNITLDLPAASTSSSTASQYVNLSVIGKADQYHCQLYYNATSNAWSNSTLTTTLLGAAGIVTNQSPGVRNKTYNFSVRTFPEGITNWNVRCNEIGNERAFSWAANRTLTVDSTFPVVTLTNYNNSRGTAWGSTHKMFDPTHGYVLNRTGLWFNYSVTEANLDRCKVYISNSGNGSAKH